MSNSISSSARLRERFRSSPTRLTDAPDGTAAEVKIEARNVVDGYDLVEHIRGKTWPFGITGLPADGSARGNGDPGRVPAPAGSGSMR